MISAALAVGSLLAFMQPIHAGIDSPNGGTLLGAMLLGALIVRHWPTRSSEPEPSSSSRPLSPRSLSTIPSRRDNPMPETEPIPVVLPAPVPASAARREEPSVLPPADRTSYRFNLITVLLAALVIVVLLVAGWVIYR